MNGKDKSGVVGAVEEWHEALLVRKALVDEEIDDCFVLVALVVGTEVVDKHRCLVLELDVARYACVAKTANLLNNKTQQV